MKKTIFLLSLVCTLNVLLSGCAKVYYSPDAVQKASTHKTIAIIPPRVSIAGNKKMDIATIKAEEASESLNFQSEIYAWMLKRKKQGRIKVDIQELAITNFKLKKLNYADNPISSSQLCKELGVDDVITSSFAIRKILPDGLGAFVGFLNPLTPIVTKSAKIDLSINDSEKLLFNYSHSAAGYYSTTPAKMVDGLMRKSSKKMPY
jgi:hypothetical protein